MPAMMRLLDGRAQTPPFAPPFSSRRRLLIGQTANILQFIGRGTGLPRRPRPAGCGPTSCSSRWRIFVVEIHDTHHPLAGSLYYEDQKKEGAAPLPAVFVKERLPKFLGVL